MKKGIGWFTGEVVPDGYCGCGRNLSYPALVTDKTVICRCGKKHKK